MKTYLVTGGAGFIGSNFIRALLASDDAATVVNFDALTYAGVPQTVDELNQDERHTFVKADIRDADAVASAMATADVVVHFAAESMVDRSIADGMPFLETNVVGTGVLLEAALRAEPELFLHVSTDEVYGSISHGAASESSPLLPSSAYSASKAGSDLLALSYFHTHGLPVVVTRCTNNYGPYQLPEKVIPLFVTNLLSQRKVPLYGDGANERDWLHVSDHCEALLLLLSAGEAGEVYNIGSGEQWSNLALTKKILSLLSLDESWIEHVPDRLGHDFRYAVDASRMQALGWSPGTSFEKGLSETVQWYQARRDWWAPLRRASV